MNANKSLLRRITSGCAVGYVVGIVIWFGFWLALRDGLWWLPLINWVALGLFVPMPIVILWAVRRRRLMWISGALIPLCIFLSLNWPYVIPHVVSHAEGPQLRVMTYNILFSNADHDATADAILNQQPDLVALQEVQPEAMEALIRRLGKTYPYWLMGNRNEYGTTAAFSRYPVRESHVLDLKADRPAVVMQVDVDAKPVVFMAAHLLAYGLEWVSLPRIPGVVNQRVFEQERQAQLLLAEAAKYREPVILGCDCNSHETSGAYRILSGQMNNAARSVGWAINQPTLNGTQHDLELLHIDYVFYRGVLDAIQVEKVQDNGGSDHLPVLAILHFSEPNVHQ